MRRLTDDQKQQVCGLLAELVGIDSAITSHEQATRDRTEARMAAFLTDHLERLGMTVDRQEVLPGRPNLMAHWPDQGGGRTLMFASHMDTVTVEGMRIDPFAAEIRDGRMWGRGTCDTKGSMAAFLTALSLATAENALPADKLYFAATMSEETGCFGASELMKGGFRTDAAIVGEPTRCELVTAHKGPLWLEIKTHGKSCHAAMPQEGVNAIDLMARVIQFVHGPWTSHIQQREHPLLGQSTWTVTRVEGGSKINILPATCRAQIDGRLIPGETGAHLVRRFAAMLADHLGDEELFSLRILEDQPPLDCPSDAPLVGRLLELCREAHGQDAPCGVNYFADTGPFSKGGITSMLFGPGDIAQAHTADEHLELRQLYLATEIILTLLTENAGRSIVN